MSQHIYEAEVKPEPIKKSPPKAATKPVETWAVEKGTPAWLLAAARARAQWPIGRELTEDEFNAAISGAKSILIGHNRKAVK